MKIVDLYSGVGGGSFGFRLAGFEPAYACESDPNARLVYAYNFNIDLKNDVGLLDPREIPHPEVVFAAPPEGKQAMGMVVHILKQIQPRAILLDFPARVIKQKIQASPFDLAGYRCWHVILNSSDYGLAQKRKSCYIVGFRKDVKTPFHGLPFPEPTGQVTLSSVFEQTPDPKLFISPQKRAAIEDRNAKNLANGMGFKTQIYGPKDITQSLSLSYWKDYRGILVDSGQGPRRLSVLECKRLMGFDDGFKLPVSDTEAYRLLAQASCPPIVAALARGIKEVIAY